MFELLKTALVSFHQMYQCQPFIVLSCEGATDEHWQLYHPRALDMPCLVATMDNGVELHPDRPL